MTKKWQEEEFYRPQQHSLPHQLSPNHLRIKRKDRDSRNSSMKQVMKKREDKYEEYRDFFAKDFPKGIAAHYQFLS